MCPISLIDNTRDFVIKVDLQAAFENGYEEMAIKFWNALSETTKAELMAKKEG